MNSPVGTTDLAAMDFNPWLKKITIVLLKMFSMPLLWS